MQAKVILFCHLRWEVMDVTDITEENRMAYMQLWKKPEKIQTWTWTGAHNLCDCTLSNSTKLFYNLSYWAIREVVKSIRISKRASMETARPQRQWREGLKNSFPCSLQACEFVKNLTSNKLLRALKIFHCKKMKKLKFWISTLMRDWHLLKHQLFHLSTMEIGSLSTCLKPHFYVSLLHWHGTLVCSGTEPFICEFLSDIFCNLQKSTFWKNVRTQFGLSVTLQFWGKKCGPCVKVMTNYLFHNVTSWSTHHIKQVVWREILRDPKCHILVCGWILTKWFEFWNCVLFKLW